MIMDYFVKPIYRDDDCSQVLKLVSEHPFFTTYSHFFRNDYFHFNEGICGLALFRGNVLVGSTLLLLHRYQSYKIGNISCTYIVPEERGKGLSSLLINNAKEYCDILFELTPVDSIVSLMTQNKIDGFRKIGNYQIWMLKNSHFINKNISLKKIHQSNEKSGIYMKTAELIVYEKKLLVSYYSFKSHGIRTGEVTFVSNKKIFSKYFKDILSIIKKSAKIRIIICDDVFVELKINGRIIPNKKNKIFFAKSAIALLFHQIIKVGSRKYMWSKTAKINFEINYLLTEYSFRR